MLTARSVVIVTVTIAVLSILIAGVSLLQEPDSGGRGSDSYGTAARGHRAIFEILSDLNVPAQRLLVPPGEDLDQQRTSVDC